MLLLALDTAYFDDWAVSKVLIQPRFWHRNLQENHGAKSKNIAFVWESVPNLCRIVVFNG